MVELTRLESHVLALIRKWQPATTYFIRKSLADTLASNISDSPGSVYPIIERLKAHGLVSAEAAAQGRRSSARLTCTHEGEQAVRLWLTRVDPSDLLPEDPLRTKIRFADLLAAEELQAWLADLRRALGELAEGLDHAGRPELGTSRGLEFENAKLLSAARIAWINSALATMQIARRDNQPFDA